MALKKHTELELDVKDLQEKISGNIRAKVLIWRRPFVSCFWWDCFVHGSFFTYMLSGRCCKTTGDTWERNSRFNHWTGQNHSLTRGSNSERKRHCHAVCLWLYLSFICLNQLTVSNLTLLVYVLWLIDMVVMYFSALYYTGLILSFLMSHLGIILD